MNNDMLHKCSADITGFVNTMLDTYDVRHVMAALGARLGEVSAAAMSAGVTRQFSLEILVATMDLALTPPDKKPAVVYVNDGEVLGRKQ